MTDELLDGLTTPEAIVAAEKNPANLARLANILMSNDREARAVELARRALVLAPDDGEVKSIAGAVLRRLVPGWHFSIVRDEARNRAYDEALRRNVRPGMQVLEIGAGSGLLAMMAARAGAAEVTSCEANGAVAATAAEIVEANGFADRVTIVAKHSRDLEVGRDLDRPADLLVSEIVSNDILGQDVLGCMENVLGRLTRAGACIIPSHGAIRVALAHYGEAVQIEMVAADVQDLLVQRAGAEIVPLLAVTIVEGRDGTARGIVEDVVENDQLVHLRTLTPALHPPAGGRCRCYLTCANRGRMSSGTP